MQLKPIFPNQCPAAVSMTYDDGLHEHLDHAIPDLERHGLRGTFYVPTVKAAAWPARTDDWRDAVTRGHEVGNHTRFHPCSKKFGWIKPNFSLEAYSLARMEDELLHANRELDEACPSPRGMRSYAYTCGEDFVGPDHASYRPTVNRLFAAGRGGSDELADPRTVDLACVPSIVVLERHGAQALIHHIDRAIDRGGWCVFMFHGIGGGHVINCARDVHQALCRHIADRRESIWCDTFLNVALAIRTATARPWKTPS